MKYLFALVLAFLLAACASVAPPPVAASAAAQPAMAWQHTGDQSFEQQRPGLGVSSRYSSSAGWIDIYRYSLRRSNWEPGVGDSQFAAHFESTVDEVRHYASRGAYTALQVAAPRDIVIGGQVFRTVNFRYSREGKPMLSTTYLTARQGQLVKYRISIHAIEGRDIDAIARSFIEENLRTESGAKKIGVPT